MSKKPKPKKPTGVAILSKDEAKRMRASGRNGDRWRPANEDEATAFNLTYCKQGCPREKKCGYLKLAATMRVTHGDYPSALHINRNGQPDCKDFGKETDGN